MRYICNSLVKRARSAYNSHKFASDVSFHHLKLCNRFKKEKKGGRSWVQIAICFQMRFVLNTPVIRRKHTFFEIINVNRYHYQDITYVFVMASYNMLS